MYRSDVSIFYFEQLTSGWEPLCWYVRESTSSSNIDQTCYFNIDLTSDFIF